MSELHHMNEWETCIAEWADRCKALSDERDELNESCMVLRGDVHMLMTQLGERDSIIAARDAQFAALPPAMTWTNKKPTKPGWYWWRHNTEFDVLNVKEVRGKLMVYSGINQPLEQLPGSWAGPLAPPMEPPQ